MPKKKKGGKADKKGTKGAGHPGKDAKSEEAFNVALEQEKAEAAAPKTTKVKTWAEPSSDEDEDPAHHYNVAASWKALFSMTSCQQLTIKEQTQRRLDLVVGLNVSQEFPWKQIKYKNLEPLLDEIDGGDVILMAMYGFNPENHLLIGYAPLLTQNKDDLPEGDPFIIFLDPEEARVALPIIRNIEMYERWLMNKRLLKKPRRWVSQGSENEITISIEQDITEPLEVEIQSVYPLTIPADKEFKLRKTSDVRDGYVELLPIESVKYDNIMRKRITLAIQVTPATKHVEQQTDPTFPTNAWAQYFYEIKEEEELDESSEDEAAKQMASNDNKRPTQASAEPVEPKPPPLLSENIKLLLDMLDFNIIDMYRNDYTHISDVAIEHYTTPYLEETLCFANITKSYERYVCGIDWYPSLSGLIITSYTFTTPATVESVSYQVDHIQRAVLQPNPILMWSFADNLNYKLEFQASREVVTLSFCPHNPNLLFGGCKNGQMILWDLQGRAEKLDYEEVLTAAQANYRLLIGDFFKWTIMTDEDSIVPPVATTELDVSQKAAITGIYWMGRHFYVNSFGKVYNDRDPNAHFKFFITCALDGTITFWDLDSMTDKKQMSSTRDQPKALTQNESVYKGKMLKPVFTVAFNEPITAIIGDTSVLSCRILEKMEARKNLKNFRTELKCLDPEEMRQSVITSSFYGRIERLNWLGMYADADGRELVTSAMNFARVHDGPVIAMKKNPFYPAVFVSIGRKVFAVWKEDYNYSPIFWRKCATDLTAVAWSEARPGVLFLTRIDGNMEAWDILSRDDDACYNDILGGGIVTAISEHRPNQPEKLLGIGDYNSSFRMVKLPPSFFVSDASEMMRFKEYFQKEENRKKSIQAWESKYFENNRDIIEAKREAEVAARKEMERIEKENILKAARKIMQEAEEKKEDTKALSYTERMKLQWDQLNLNRLLGILMTRKRVNEEKLERETRLEKEHLAYEAAKRASLARILQHVGEEVAEVRSRILPAEKADLQRIDMIMSSVNELMELADSYNNIESEANEMVNNFDMFDTLNYVNFLDRGEHRRMLLNKSVGGNTERQYWYECVKEEDTLDDCEWGYDNFLLAYVDWWEGEDEARAQFLVSGFGSVLSADQSDQLLDKVESVQPVVAVDELVQEFTGQPEERAVDDEGGLVQPAGDETVPATDAEQAAPPIEGEPQATEGEAQPVEGEPQPTEGEPQPTEGGPQPTEGEPQPIDGEAQPTQGETQPAEGEPPAEA